MLPKPKKKCKYCLKEFEKSTVPTRILGGSKFCSYRCYYRNKLVSTPDEALNEFEKEFKKISKENFKSRTKKIRASLPIKLNKNKADRDKQYIEFVKNLPCMVCQQPSTAHHMDVGGMGIKGSDYSCVNLCDNHHTLGSNSIHRLGTDEFEEKHCIDLTAHQIQLLKEYVRVLVKL